MSNNKVVAYTGHPAPRSGQYHPAGAGRNVEVTLSRGDVTPPNRSGVQQRFVLVDPTKHKR